MFQANRLYNACFRVDDSESSFGFGVCPTFFLFMHVHPVALENSQPQLVRSPPV